MLKFFLDKFRETKGPLKQARLVVSDVIEELYDLAKHYLRSNKAESECSECSSKHAVTETPDADVVEPAAAQSNEREKKSASRSPNAPKRPPAKSTARSTSMVDVPEALIRAMAVPANQKKQEFKVLAILWDAHTRGIKDLSAKSVSDHGTKLGLIIRHENVRKVIRMQLGGYVESIQNRKAGTSIYHYRITDAGILHFKEKYL